MPFTCRRKAPSRLALAIASALAVALSNPTSAAGQPKPPTLTLSAALERAGTADPRLGAFDARAQAAEAGVRQAGARLNPSLGVEVENFAGTGAYSLLDRVETTLTYEQTLERGGKRAARMDRARAELEVARRRREVRRLDLIKEVQVAYADALAAEAELLLADARLVAAHSAQRDIARRVKAARDPLFAGSRAEAVTAQAEIERDQARDAARNARATLARYWDGAPDFVLDLESFFQVAAPATAAPIAVADLALLEAERDGAIAAVRVEQTRAVTDPTVRAGVRYFGDGANVALVVGGSIPIGRYDTNQGGIARARAERTAAEVDIAAARTVGEREIARLTARLAASSRETERIRLEVIPPAIQAVEQVRDGFNRGGFQYIDVVEAERGLADARARRVAVLRQHHLDQAALDRLTGRHAGQSTSTSIAERR
ncbi:TolC family protein [Phenylobacterium sp.]|uniref:TolC family protein n=1 Tax=Phenylobacterium sp. TaxID=1871053 RepID=UPI00286A9C72|nr:TolC family protein [Phenylobacterium sp.]